MATFEEYVGYLNNSDLFIEAMYDEKKNPNGIGKIKLCVDSSSLLDNTIGLGSNSRYGMNKFYETIFGLNNELVSYSKEQSAFEKPIQSDLTNITKTIKFIVNDDFNLGGGNNWEESLQKIMDSEAGKSLYDSFKKFKQGSGIINKIFRGGIAATQGAMALSGVKFQTLMQTVKFWTGSKTPTFDFSFNLLATRPDMDIRRDLIALYATVYPISITDANESAMSSLINAVKNNNWGELLSAFTGGALSGFMSAPLGYNPVDGYLKSLSPITEDGSGMIDVRVGKWLHIPNCVADAFDAVISKVTTRFGFPLYAKCTIRLTPSRMWTISDVHDMFFSTATSDEDSTGEVLGQKTHNFGQADEGKITLFGDLP